MIEFLKLWWRILTLQWEYERIDGTIVEPYGGEAFVYICVFIILAVISGSILYWIYRLLKLIFEYIYWCMLSDTGRRILKS